MTTVTKGATTLTPTLVLGYGTETQSRNVLHSIIGRPDFDVSLADDELRSGELQYFFDTAAGAWALWTLHQTAGVFTLADTDLPQINMLYVRNGRMSNVLDDTTRRRWTVTVGYQEVLA